MSRRGGAKPGGGGVLSSSNAPNGPAAFPASSQASGRAPPPPFDHPEVLLAYASAIRPWRRGAATIAVRPHRVSEYLQFTARRRLVNAFFYGRVTLV
jgi:hypothetical protein